jgi:hypothetical protein
VGYQVVEPGLGVSELIIRPCRILDDILRCELCLGERLAG